MTHEIQVSRYKTIPSSIKLGTFDSYGTEKIHFTFGSGWENLAVYATFTAPNGKSVQTDVDIDGNTNVPPEATAEQAGQGEIVLVGKAEGVNRITVSLYYTVLEHGPVQGTEPAVPTPDLLQQVLTLSRDAQVAAKNAEQSAKNAVKDATDTVKPFKEEAVQAAAGAALSQKSAAESQNAAKASADAAATSEGNAAASAKKAQDVADSLPADYMTAVNEIAALKTSKADKAELETAQKQISANTKARHSHTNKEVIDGITGQVTADKVNAPDHLTDLVQYAAFQIAAQQIISQIPTVPDVLPNPKALTIKIGSATVTYDGSTAQTVTIADGTEVAY